jgi:hypothetical protein
MESMAYPEDRCCCCRYYLGRSPCEGWCARVAPGRQAWEERIPPALSLRTGIPGLPDGGRPAVWRGTGMAQCGLAAPPALERVEAWAKELGEPVLRLCQGVSLTPDAQAPVLVQAHLVAACTWLADCQRIEEDRYRKPGHPDACKEAWMLYLALVGERLQLTEPLGTPRAFSHGEPSEG